MEAFIFRLGGVLGGRKEVIQTPARELLKFMSLTLEQQEMEAEREKARVYLNYLANVYAQPSMGKEDAQIKQGRKEFLDSITPKLPGSAKGQAQVFDWDENLMKKIAARQKGGR